MSDVIYGMIAVWATVVMNFRFANSVIPIMKFIVITSIMRHELMGSLLNNTYLSRLVYVVIVSNLSISLYISLLLSFVQMHDLRWAYDKESYRSMDRVIYKHRYLLALADIFLYRLLVDRNAVPGEWGRRYVVVWDLLILTPLVVDCRYSHYYHNPKGALRKMLLTMFDRSRGLS